MDLLKMHKQFGNKPKNKQVPQHSVGAEHTERKHAKAYARP